MKSNGLLSWLPVGALLVFVLYQKGIIFANFESIDAKQAFVFYEDNNSTFIDVRENEELVKDGAIAGAIHIPLGSLEENLEKLQAYHDRKLVVFCRSGNRSVSASRTLSNAGFTTYNLSGGINAWKSQRLAVR